MLLFCNALFIHYIRAHVWCIILWCVALSVNIDSARWFAFRWITWMDVLPMSCLFLIWSDLTIRMYCLSAACFWSDWIFAPKTERSYQILLTKWQECNYPPSPRCCCFLFCFPLSTIDLIWFLLTLLFTFFQWSIAKKGLCVFTVGSWRKRRVGYWESLVFSLHVIGHFYQNETLTCDLMQHESNFDLMNCKSDTYFWLKKCKLDFDVRKCKSVFDL